LVAVGLLPTSTPALPAALPADVTDHDAPTGAARASAAMLTASAQARTTTQLLAAVTSTGIVKTAP
jgi:hypothetical protein